MQDTPPNKPAEWFTIETLFTAAGTTTAVLVTTAVFKKVFPNWDGFRVAFVLSMALAFLAVPITGDIRSWPDWVLAFFNGILTLAAATGTNTAITKSQSPSRWVH